VESNNLDGVILAKLKEADSTSSPCLH